MLEKFFKLIKKTIKYTFVLMILFIVYSFTLRPFVQRAYIYLVVYTNHNEMEKAAQNYRQAIYNYKDKEKIIYEKSNWGTYAMGTGDNWFEKSVNFRNKYGKYKNKEMNYYERSSDNAYLVCFDLTYNILLGCETGTCYQPNDFDSMHSLYLPYTKKVVTKKIMDKWYWYQIYYEFD